MQKTIIDTNQKMKTYMVCLNLLCFRQCWLAGEEESEEKKQKHSRKFSPLLSDGKYNVSSKMSLAKTGYIEHKFLLLYSHMIATVRFKIQQSILPGFDKTKLREHTCFRPILGLSGSNIHNCELKALGTDVDEIISKCGGTTVGLFGYSDHSNRSHVVIECSQAFSRSILASRKPRPKIQS